MEGAGLPGLLVGLNGGRNQNHSTKLVYLIAKRLHIIPVVGHLYSKVTLDVTTLISTS